MAEVAVTVCQTFQCLFVSGPPPRACCRYPRPAAAQQGSSRQSFGKSDHNEVPMNGAHDHTQRLHRVRRTCSAGFCSGWKTLRALRPAKITHPQSLCDTVSSTHHEHPRGVTAGAHNAFQLSCVYSGLVQGACRCKAPLPPWDARRAAAPRGPTPRALTIDPLSAKPEHLGGMT